MERIIEAEEERACVSSLANEADGRGGRKGEGSCAGNREASRAQGVMSDGFFRHA